MAAFASLWTASALVRAASLNLCSDEYLLLIARPGEAVSVTRLAQDRAESPLAALANRVPGNGGRIEEVIALRPDLVLTMGGAGRSSGAIARALGTRALALRQPSSIAEVAANLRLVATALGDPGRALPWLRRLALLAASRPRIERDAIYLSHGGLSQSPGSLGTQWMALAGLLQRPLPNGRASIEMLVTSPPDVLLRSTYRSGQISQGQRWLTHPLVSRSASRMVTTDGRAWTCAGPLMIAEIERLKRVMR